jgi:hypothetical protein
MKQPDELMQAGTGLPYIQEGCTYLYTSYG